MIHIIECDLLSKILFSVGCKDWEVKILESKLWNTIEKIVYCLLDFLFKCIKKDLSNEVFTSVMQFVKFGIVGASNTIISYVIYTVSLLILRKIGVWNQIDYLVAQVIAFVLSVLWSFYWNNKMVFTLQEGEERSILRSLIKAFVSYAFTGLFLNSILLILWVQMMCVSEFMAPIFNLAISVPVNYVINKFWAFKKEKE